MATDFSVSTSDADNADVKPDGARRRDSVLRAGEFAWTPLRNPKTEIRLCSIEPGPVGSQLRLSLRTVNMEDSIGHYCCLSYAWKSTRTTHSILLHGFCHPIHRNLHLQLSRLRALRMTQPLWCDAICIAQSDEDEQSKQVAIMGRIFANASRVFLGVDEGGLSMMPRPTEDTTRTLQAAIESLCTGAHLSDLDIFSCKDGGPANGSSTNSNACRQWQRIVTSSLWSRCWGVQEAVRARNAAIIGEWGVISWSSIVQALEAYDHHRQGCCALFVDTLSKDVRSEYYKVSSLTVG